MSETNEGNGAAILIAALAGAVVGAGVALLLAPRTGKETRAWLADQGSQLKEKTTRAYEQGVQAIRQKASGSARTEDGELYAGPNAGSDA